MICRCPRVSLRERRTFPHLLRTFLVPMVHPRTPPKVIFHSNKAQQCIEDEAFPSTDTTFRPMKYQAVPCTFARTENCLLYTSPSPRD